MKLPSSPGNYLCKLLPILTMTLGGYCAILPVHAEDLYSQIPVTDAREASPTSFEDSWFRQIRFDMWEANGANPQEILRTLKKIANSTEPRANPNQLDSVIKFGSGHWGYEFSKVAQQNENLAKGFEKKGLNAETLSAYRAAAAYYLIAAFPNLGDPEQEKALIASRRNYKAAGQYFAVPLETQEFDMGDYKFEAYLHLPKNGRDQPLAIILRTGGIDEMDTEFYHIYDQLSHDGIAMITFNIPSTGNGGVLAADSDKHHERVLHWVLADERFDPNRVAIWSSSMGGNPAVKMAIKYPSKLQAVVNSCGLIHGVLSPAIKITRTEGVTSSIFPETIIKTTQTMSYEVFLVRLGLKTGASVEDVFAAAKPVSLVEQNLLGNETVTPVPILSINTHFDPIVPHSDTLSVAIASEHGEIWFRGDFGHCSPANTDPEVYRWVAKHLQ